MSEKERLYKKYERQHRERLKKYGTEIDILYKKSIDNIAAEAAGTTLKDGVFKLEKYPKLNQKINQVLEQLSKQIEVTLYTSIANEWLQSDLKNDSIFKSIYKDVSRNDELLTLRNPEAYKEFIERVDKGGLNLSKRIYKQTELYRLELEAGLADGIAYGKSAAEMGRDLKKYLYEPDKLFRRSKEKIRVEIKDANGKVIRIEERVKYKLSKPALDYKPGQGVYRSSAKNIQRLTRTETNMSYRKADSVRYQGSPFVVGFEVKLSLSHPRYDICDQLAGNYPRTFVFVGWHPQCLCYNIPILLTPEQYNKMEDDLFAGKDVSDITKYTGKPEPSADQAKQWFIANEDRIKNWNSEPYFLKDNADFFKK